MLRLIPIIALAIISTLVGCAHLDDIPGKTVSENGTIRYVDLEGGFYGIVNEYGTQYRPTHILPRFQIDGMHIEFKAKISENEPGISAWGTPVQILEIAERNDEKIITTSGTVHYVDLEGGFYGITAESGMEYRPVNTLEERFQQDNLNIRFQARVRTDMGGIQMWGTPVEIIKIYD